MNEISTLRLLKHKNIISLYEVYEDAKNVHLVFELMRGGELYTRVKSVNYLKEWEAAEIMKELLETVEFCHKNAIMHRDIKPRNIILRYDNITLSKKDKLSLKLIDFGLSMTNSEGKTRNLVGGTPGYIAPEVLMQYSFDEKVDVYSCGIVLYFMLAGDTPFTGNTINKVLALNKRNDICFDKCPWISEEAKSFILKLTTINPYARLNATNALKDEWLTKAVDVKVVNELKSIADSSKVDSFGFFEALVKSIISEFSLSNKDDHADVLLKYSCNEKTKISKNPSIQVQSSLSSIEGKTAAKITLHKRSGSNVDKKRKEKDSESNTDKTTSCNEVSSHKSNSNVGKNNETGGLSKLKKSIFGLKAQGILQ